MRIRSTRISLNDALRRSSTNVSRGNIHEVIVKELEVVVAEDLSTGGPLGERQPDIAFQGPFGNRGERPKSGLLRASAGSAIDKHEDRLLNVGCELRQVGQ